MQIDDEGDLIKAIYASVPAGSPQNAAYAEHLAAMQAAAHTEKEHQITLVVDCGSVVNSAQAGIEYATNFKRPMGGLWRRFDYMQATHRVIIIIIHTPKRRAKPVY